MVVKVVYHDYTEEMYENVASVKKSGIRYLDIEFDDGSFHSINLDNVSRCVDVMSGAKLA